jgi:uncharacterized protein YggE
MHYSGSPLPNPPPEYQGRGKTSLNVLFAAAAILACSLFSAATALAQSNDGITVRGIGTASAKPTEVEFDAVVSGDGELAADAQVKYQDTKRKAIAALNALGIPDLTVEPQGQAIQQSAGDMNQQMRIMNGNVPPAAKPHVQINEELRVRIKGVDKQDPDALIQNILKVMDASRDAGLQIGPSGPMNSIQAQLSAGTADDLVHFVIPDKTDLEAQAYQIAMDDARAKAEKLAKLSGLQLGGVAWVQDEGAPSGNSDASARTSVIQAIYGVTPPATPDRGKEISSGTLADIPVTVNVIMHFNVAK